MALPSLQQTTHVLVNVSFLCSLVMFSFYFSPAIHDCKATSEFELTSETRGYIDYLNLFYCVFEDSPVIGCTFLSLWLIVLFYLLGDTASQYFCSSLEGLSRVLNLPPTIAGVTLLSLGNGAPDVLASIVSFTTTSDGGSGLEVGLNSILGGSFFVSSAVLGLICICVPCSTRTSVDINSMSFIRDLCFLLLVLFFILLLLIIGKIQILCAVAFVSLYIIYVLIVSLTHRCRKDLGEHRMPLLESLEAAQSNEEEYISNVSTLNTEVPSVSPKSWLMLLIELPLYLPRRLTIPVVTQERWSKPFTVSSVTLAPILLATLWNSRAGEINSEQRTTVFFFSALLGLVLGITAMECTEDSHPPKKLQLPLVAVGFLMSVVWTYIIAGELVPLLVCISRILHVSPSVIGVTVLAWGNSVGDLLANVFMAVNGGEAGVQVAITGCYAGPIFNSLVGLGLSFVVCSWKAYPRPFAIVTKDQSEFVLIGFAIGGLLWALVMLPRKGMMPDRVFGVGLLVIYSCFLGLRLLESLHILHPAVSLHV